LFYDLLGLPFLLFIRRRPKTLVVWSVVALAPLLLIALALTVIALGDPAGGAGGERPPMPALSADLSGPAERVYGSYLKMVGQRVREYFTTLPLSLLYLFWSLLCSGPVQGEAEACALAEVALDVDLAAVRLDKAAGYGETEPGSGCAAGRVLFRAGAGLLALERALEDAR
ncbi:MAG: hypothetical protein M3N18_11355, partial [Actinomycetota bacterium]|nr:hypothetical protein [Actinomycetota bacterium]